MATTTVTQKDISDAEQFLVQFQSEKIPDASFEVGSASRDILIKGFAAMYAFLRGEIDAVAARQSLLRIQEELTDADDISQAVDEVLSNWFVHRRGGQISHVTARLHFTQKRAQAIPLAAKFWRTSSLIFYVDSPSDPYVISEDRLFPMFDSRGVLIDYVVDIPLKAAQTGTSYRISPGTFIRVEVSGGLPYFSYAENTEEASGGLDVESSTELIARSDTAMSVRNLVNNRSCDVTLSEQFPDLMETLTIGMGEPEMTRDRRREIASHLQLFLGGHYDTYLSLPLTTVEENLSVGGYFARPDNIISIFRDPYLTHDLSGGRTFISLGIQPGHVLYIISGIVGTPMGFVITDVSDHELTVSGHTAFTEASDEFPDPLDNIVRYSVGWLSPGFAEVDLEGTGVYDRGAAQSVDPLYENIPWGTSRKIQQPGKVVLSGRPIQNIKWVEVTNPDTSDPLVDPTTGTFIFNNRTNYPPVKVGDASGTMYQLVTTNPEKGQSMEAVNTLIVGYADGWPAHVPPIPDMGYFDGKNLRIVYETLLGFEDIHNYVMDRNQRVQNANQLVKARYPVWLQMVIPYRKRPSATGDLDEDAARTNVVNFVNNSDPNDDFDITDITTMLRTYYDVIGAIYPITMTYHLDSPDGQQVWFETTDLISVFMTNGVTLTSTDLIPPQDLWDRGITQILTIAELSDYFNYLGVTDRVVQYRTEKSLISFVLQS